MIVSICRGFVRHFVFLYFHSSLIISRRSTVVSSFTLQARTTISIRKSVTTRSSNAINPFPSAHDLEGETETEPTLIDNRPHAARATRPRPARRVNHAFKYLYRHVALEEGDEGNGEDEGIGALPFLMKYGNLTEAQVLKMNETFPPLLTLNVKRHLHPKLLFLQRTLGIITPTLLLSIPPSYFGARLERIVAPRHAFFVHHQLHHNLDLPRFLHVCSSSSHIFAAYCNTLSKEQQHHSTPHSTTITALQVEAWDVIFQRGLMSACRKEGASSWTAQHHHDSQGLVALLLSHGAHPYERDSSGATLLHWACGSGNVDAVPSLLQYLPVNVTVERDGATPLHWAAAGAHAKAFGTGGHLDVCQYLLLHHDDEASSSLVEQRTKDGNSVLMWAAWSGTLSVVQWLVQEHGADAFVKNRNGCTVAHWAASGGSLETCRYLKDVVGVDFTEPNHGGNTPLTHAVAFGRVEVVAWLQSEGNHVDDAKATELARDFVKWTNGDEQRTKVLSLFD